MTQPIETYIEKSAKLQYAMGAACNKSIEILRGRTVSNDLEADLDLMGLRNSHQRMRAAAENAERVMEHAAHELAALPLVQNDLAMDLIQAVAELRKARGN